MKIENQNFHRSALMKGVLNVIPMSQHQNQSALGFGASQMFSFCSWSRKAVPPPRLCQIIIVCVCMTESSWTESEAAGIVLQ